MVKYLDAELYKVTHRRTYTYGALAVVLGGVCFLHFLMCNFTGGKQTMFESSVSQLELAMMVGIYLALMVADMVFSDQYKLNTLKNEVSYGLPRGQIYLGKLAAAVTTASVFCAVIVVFYLGLAALLFPAQGDPVEKLIHLFATIAAAFPLWLGALGFMFMLLFVTRGSTMAVVLFTLANEPLSMLLGLLMLFTENAGVQAALKAIQAWLLCNCFDTLYTTGGLLMSRCWLVGTAWFAVSTAIGLVVFQKREIN